MSCKISVVCVASALLAGQLVAGQAWAADVLAPASVRFAAADVKEDPSFQRHVLPLMGRLGCNGRACHGSFQGQGGFRLSLFGYDFKADHEALLTGEKPRIDLEDPEGSLALQKPTHHIPHKGGLRMKPESWEYRLFLRWIEGGAKPVTDDDARFERLVVEPSQIVFDKAGATTQLKVTAYWTGGIQEDVTPLCRFRTNDESISEISPDGLVTSVTPGATHVVVFYDNGVAPVETLLPVSEFLADRYPSPPTPTRIDGLVVDKLKTLGIIPAELSEDAEFLRRVSLDITGTLPAATEVEAFLADSSSDKRTRKIDELLERLAYAAWWATRLCDTTGNNPQNLEERYVQNQQARQWYEWIYRRVRENKPYDQIVEGIVVATSRKPGQSYDEYLSEMGAYNRKQDPADFAQCETMPLFWARRTFKDPAERSLGFAYSFLGLRLQCAQCHKHPFDQWTQDDFKQFTGFFSRVTYGTAPDARKPYQEMQKALGKDKKKQQELIATGDKFPWREVFLAAPGDRGNRKGKKNRPQATVAVTAKFLGGDNVELEKDRDPREMLMSWLRERDNPWFARSFVNRVWAAYFGVGIIEPADDLNLANPPSNGPLLDYLTQGFIDHNFDMKWLHREIANSRTYQLSWKTNDTNRHDSRMFSHALPRRLPAEVAYDAIQTAMASAEDLAAAAADPTSRAIAQANTYGRAKRGPNANYALSVFGRPARLTNCDCERSNEASLLQTIYLRNDQELLGTIERSGWLRQIDGAAREVAAAEERAAPPGKGKQRDLQVAVKKVKQRMNKARKQGNDEQVARLERNLAALEIRLDKERNAEPKPEQPAEEEAAEERVPQPAVVAAQVDPLIREAFLRTVSRPPTEAELARGREHFTQVDGVSDGMRDLLWALLNTKEFIVNH